MSIRGTESFIYYTDNILGSGSSGKVYFGRHKRKGDACAVKIFMNGRAKIQQNELQLMRRLNHENIVQLIAIEKDSRTNDEALIMEYCSEGSLQDYLKQPQNCYGFKDIQMIEFCRQLASGLKYLWTHGITHRDIKPGNILCAKRNDDKIVYKITDFGCSREYLIQMNQNGLYGTEEYLHPKIFMHIMKSEHIPDGSETIAEIWAVGVTIYQVACGKLPFLVPENRKNKLQMYNLLINKKSGDISGTSDVRGETTHYSNSLPNTCLLSKNVQNYLVDLIAQALESNEKLQLNYETFFPAVENLTNASIFYVFMPLTCKRDIVLIPDGISDDAKQNIIIEKFPDVYFYSSDYLIKSTSILSMFQKSSYSKPLLILEKNLDVNFDISFDSHFIFPKYPKYIREQPLGNDSDWARNSCSFLQRIYDVFLQLNDFKINYTQTVYVLLIKIREYLHIIDSKFVIYQKILQIILTKWKRSIGKTQNSEREIEIQKDIDFFKSNLESIEYDIKELSHWMNENKKSSFEVLTVEDKRLLETKMNLEIARETVDNFSKDKHRTLSYNDNQIHKLQRTTLDLATKKMWDILKLNVWKETLETKTQFFDFYKESLLPQLSKIENIFQNWIDKDKIELLVNKIIYINNEDFWKNLETPHLNTNVNNEDFEFLLKIVQEQDILISNVKKAVTNNEEVLDRIKKALNV